MDKEDYGVEASKKLYPAIELLRDAQGLGETTLKRIQTTGANAFRFEHKLLAMNFVTRLVGNHELLLLNLYPFLRRYMGGHHRDVRLFWPMPFKRVMRWYHLTKCTDCCRQLRIIL